MALVPETAFIGQIKPSTPAYPYGEAQDIVTPGDGKGTPWRASLVNDLFGFQQALLSESSIVPTGTPETATASQYLEAIKAIAGKTHKSLSEAVADQRLKIGQLISTAGYDALGDGGHASYKVVAAATGTEDFGSFLDTNNGLQLQLIKPSGTYTPAIFGVFPDEVTNWEADESARFEAMQQYGLDNNLTLTWPAGYYATSINMSPAKSGAKWHFEPGAELGGILHVIGTSAAAPLTDVSITGSPVTYDRLGIQFTERVYIQRTHCKSDAAKNTASGTVSRGCHISETNIDLTIDYLEIDDCTNGNNSDAALAIDGTPSSFNLTIGYAWIKDSQTNGFYMMGDNINIGILRIDAFCSLIPTRLPIGSNAGQDTRGKGAWFNRVWDSKIGKLIVHQNFDGFTRGNTDYHVLFDETGITSSPETTKRPLEVESIVIRNAASNGAVTFGDPVALSSNLNVIVGTIDVQMEPGKTFGAPLTEAAVRVDNVPGKVKIGTIRFFQTEDQAALFTRVGSKLTLGSLETNSRGDGTANPVKIEGYIDGYPTFDIDVSGVSSTSTAFLLRSVGSNGSKVGGIHVHASSGVDTPAVHLENAAQIEVQSIRTDNTRNTVSNVRFEVLQFSRIGGLNLVGAGAVGVGCDFDDVLECSFENGRITGFAKGVTSTTKITRSNVINLHSQTNTVNTDIPALSFEELNATNVQL